MRTRTFGLLISAGAVLMLAGTIVSAQMMDEVITKRQGVMKDMVKAMGYLGDTAKGAMAFNASGVKERGELIVDHAKMIPTVFETRVTDGKTDAKAEIWADFASFRSKAMDLEKAASDLVAQASSESALGGNVKSLGGTCGGCHREFRKKKEESYKNM